MNAVKAVSGKIETAFFLKIHPFQVKTAIVKKPIFVKNFKIKMMKNILTLLAITLLFACSNNDEEPNSENSKPKVYVVGGVNSDGVKIWKDGEVISLTKDSNSSFASSIYVTNSNDVYVSGGEDKDKPVIWKNGKKTLLSLGTDVTAFVDDVIVTKNKDVYAVGSGYNGDYSVAKMWKNGTPFYLTDGQKRSEAFSVFAVENDIYVAGYEYNDSRKKVAKIWKNGKEIALTSGYDNAYANDIFVEGNNVHVVGAAQEGNVYNAKYWLNGKEVTLSDLGIGSCFAKSIYVNNSDVYIVGNEVNSLRNEVGKYWKNGKPVFLTNESVNGSVKQVFVKNNNVYIIGEENRKPILWVNDQPKELIIGSGTFFNEAIFVK